MTIELPERLPYSVDTFSAASNRKRHHFVTHAHKDHSIGITLYASFPIYSTSITKSILLIHYPKLDESLFVNIEIGQTLVIDGDFSVTAFDANHCPGAIMLLFEGSFGNYLHTGDCRLTPECLRNLPDKYMGRKGQAPRCRLDCIFLDCTFGKFPHSMPSRQSATQQAINCIWKHPDASIVYLACDLLGQEEVLVNVSRTFGSKIYVDKEKDPECFQTLELIVPEILSSDTSCRFQLFDGCPGVYERAHAKMLEARSNLHQEPLVLRASAQWYAFEGGSSDTEKRKKVIYDQPVRDLLGVWHVCYSIHSSREELEWALQLLAPKWVVSTTPSCRATELSYVQKKCKLTADNPFWKLLNIHIEVLSSSDVLGKGLSYILEETDTGNHVKCHTEPIVKPSSPLRKLMAQSHPSKRACITLFGRARLGPHDPIFMNAEDKIVTGDGDSYQTSNKPEIHILPIREVAEGELRSPEKITTKDATVTKNNSVESWSLEEIKSENDDSTLIDLSRDETSAAQIKEAVEVDFRTLAEAEGVDVSETKLQLEDAENNKCHYDENMRKFYRSMHVVMPRPLPSLVKLMNGNKYAKRRF
ncbi:DNA metabolism protein [Lithospermum erythrorhizon]|uniref:DNA metabolism protein n=1 Tax=Lithospermum erythrorhizon TaxID=34254 RepID=A0AAV3NUS1_LITER